MQVDQGSTIALIQLTWPASQFTAGASRRGSTGAVVARRAGRRLQPTSCVECVSCIFAINAPPTCCCR